MRLVQFWAEDGRRAVAVLDDQDRVHLRNVILGHNLDAEVQIVSGVKATDRVVNTPSLGLLEGQQVKVVQPVAGYQSGPGGQGAVSKEPITASTAAPSGATAAGGPSLPTPPAIANSPSPACCGISRNGGAMPWRCRS